MPLENDNVRVLKYLYLYAIQTFSMQLIVIL